MSNGIPMLIMTIRMQHERFVRPGRNRKGHADPAVSGKISRLNKPFIVELVCESICAMRRVSLICALKDEV